MPTNFGRVVKMVDDEADEPAPTGPGANPEAIIDARVREWRQTHPSFTYATALHRVVRDDPALAAAYADPKPTRGPVMGINTTPPSVINADDRHARRQQLRNTAGRLVDELTKKKMSEGSCLPYSVALKQVLDSRPDLREYYGAAV